MKFKLRIFWSLPILVVLSSCVLLDIPDPYQNVPATFPGLPGINAFNFSDPNYSDNYLALQGGQENFGDNLTAASHFVLLPIEQGSQCHWVSSIDQLGQIGYTDVENIFTSLGVIAALKVNKAILDCGEDGLGVPNFLEGTYLKSNQVIPLFLEEGKIIPPPNIINDIVEGTAIYFLQKITFSSDNSPDFDQPVKLYSPDENGTFIVPPEESPSNSSIIRMIKVIQESILEEYSTLLLVDF